MEYVDGSIMTDKKSIPVNCISQANDALDHMRKQGICPSFLGAHDSMIDTEGNLKIIDMGCYSKLKDE